MKKEWGLLLAAAGLLLLLVPGLYFGCFSRQEQQGTMLSEAAEKEEIRYISQTAPEDCYLCGKKPFLSAVPPQRTNECGDHQPEYLRDSAH